MPRDQKTGKAKPKPPPNGKIATGEPGRGFSPFTPQSMVAVSLDERKAMEHTELPPMRDWIMRKRLSDRFYRLIAKGETNVRTNNA